MGVLYEMSQKLMQEVEVRYPNPMDQLRAKGEIARTAGFMVSLIGAGDMDDPDKIDCLRRAGSQLGIQL